MMAWSMAGRFGYAMMNLSLLLYARAATGSFAIAGALSAASLVGVAAGTVAQGRAIDRWGPARVLLAVAPAHAVLGAAVITGLAAGLHAGTLAPMVAAQSAVLPAVGVASRILWPRLIPPGPLRDRAYTYEAVSFEVCWLTGPALAGLLATLLWPGTALLTATVLVTVAAVGLAATRAARSPAPAVLSPSPASGRGAAVHRAGLATLLVAGSAFGLTIGFVVVGVAAGTAANGRPQLAGVLLAAWSASSILGGLAFGRWRWPSPADRLPALMLACGLTLVIPALVGGLLPLTAMILTGLTLAPQAALHSMLLDDLVPAARLSTAYGWVTTTIWAANAAGQGLGGVAVQAHGHHLAYLLAAAASVFPALVVWAARRHLLGTPRPTHTTRPAPATE
jgi:hypothetical protein